MQTTSISNSVKSSTNSPISVKKVLLSLTLALTCFTPSMALAQSNSEIQQLAERQQDYKIQVDNLQAELGMYVIANFRPAAAVLASGVGIGAVLQENLDPSTKAAFAFAGAIGTSYCLDSRNFQYCAKVATDMTTYGIKISNYNQAINSISQRISSLQS
jgi:hypothetical protein